MCADAAYRQRRAFHVTRTFFHCCTGRAVIYRQVYVNGRYLYVAHDAVIGKVQKIFVIRKIFLYLIDVFDLYGRNRFVIFMCLFKGFINFRSVELLKLFFVFRLYERLRALVVNRCN